MTAEIIQLSERRDAHRPEMVEVSAAYIEGLQIENQVIRAEHATYVAQVRQYNRSAQLSLLSAGGDTNAALHWLGSQDQITERAIARIRGASLNGPNDSPAIAMRKAA